MLMKTGTIRHATAPVLNIGLKTRDGGTITAQQALTVLRWSLGRTALDWAAVGSTLVVEVDAKLSEGEALLLAERLRQGTVAQFDGYHGQLYGPDAEAFDLRRFYAINGQPMLAERIAA